MTGQSNHARGNWSSAGTGEGKRRRPAGWDRREFLQLAGAASAGLIAGPLAASVACGKDSDAPAEQVVRTLYASLTAKQKSQICFDWNYQDPKRGLLRTRIAANWNITKPTVKSDFFTREQQHLVRAIFEAIIRPDWHARIDQQLQDDTGGFGNDQSIAIFGDPEQGKFQFALTGRHMTLRCDGNSAEHVAFGGPIFYGHAAEGFNEKPNHPGNVYWPQAVAANKVYRMLDPGQRKQATVAKSPGESRVGFRSGAETAPGIAVSDLSSDQRDLVSAVLHKLVEPYRAADQQEVLACLKAQGGLEKCHLAFYSDKDIGKDQVWDNWRLEGPSFVWYFRGSPHVHVWVNVADDATVKLNS